MTSGDSTDAADVIAACNGPVRLVRRDRPIQWWLTRHWGVAALSADGSTLAVGADSEGSRSTGINGNQTDNSAPYAGAVYVFTRTGSTWLQQAYIKASNTNADDGFGWSLALSADGSTLAVGALGEGSSATGINGNQLDDSATSAGAVYVY